VNLQASTAGSPASTTSGRRFPPRPRACVARLAAPHRAARRWCTGWPRSGCADPPGTGCRRLSPARGRSSRTGARAARWRWPRWRRWPPARGAGRSDDPSGGGGVSVRGGGVSVHGESQQAAGVVGGAPGGEHQPPGPGLHHPRMRHFGGCRGGDYPVIGRLRWVAVHAVAGDHAERAVSRGSQGVAGVLGHGRVDLHAEDVVGAEPVAACPAEADHRSSGPASGPACHERPCDTPCRSGNLWRNDAEHVQLLFSCGDAQTIRLFLAGHECAGSGTGSCVMGVRGRQRPSRLMVSQLPRRVPWVWSACAAYSEQVGVK
jgi:hypothetical protein